MKYSAVLTSAMCKKYSETFSLLDSAQHVNTTIPLVSGQGNHKYFLISANLLSSCLLWWSLHPSDCYVHFPVSFRIIKSDNLPTKFLLQCSRTTVFFVIQIGICSHLAVFCKGATVSMVTTTWACPVGDLSWPLPTAVPTHDVTTGH